MSLPLPLPQKMVVNLFFFILFPSSYLCLPPYNDDSASSSSSTTTTLQTLKPILPSPGPSPSPSHSAAASIIPAFPEQSDFEGCPLTLSDEFFNGIESACGTKHGSSDMELHRTRCCPVLAAWLYSAYSATALTHTHIHTTSSSSSPSPSPSLSSYEMPLLPDDSGTCVNELGKALKVRGVELIRPNETCDLVYCFCGIKLHPLTCPDAFSITQSGELVGDSSVRRLERSCISSSNNVNGFPGLGGCSKCLNSLYLLNKKTSNSSKAEDRTTKIHNKDCELMGLTWLLAKNRSAYIHTVSGVLRALMLSTDGANPQSCTLNSDGMPLAVDSSQISDNSSSETLQAPMSLCLLLLCFLQLMQFGVLFF